MSRATITTGNITFTTAKADTRPPQRDGEGEQSCHILIIGDFSGRASSGNWDAESLLNRPIIEVDRDNIDEVFSKLKVRLQLPISEQPLHFDELDELHPDVLVERLALFDQFHALKRRLRQPQHFEAALQEIQSWQGAEVDAEEETPEGIPLPDNLLEAMFTQRNEPSHQTTLRQDIDHLVRGLVAPYVIKQADPRLPALEQAVDEAMAATLRSLMHTSAFQTLEANWRGLDWLLRRLETNRQLKVFLLDSSHGELIDDVINSEEFQHTALYRRLVDALLLPGTAPFAVIQSNFTLEDDIDDLQLAALLGSVAQAHGGVALAGGSEKLAGCAQLVRQPERSEWDYEIEETVQAGWQALREDEVGFHLALVAPRFLLRLPYGAQTVTIDAFPFEELGLPPRHELYLWGNSAHLVSLALASHFQHAGRHSALTQSVTVEDLPLHVYRQEGEAVAQPIAEVWLRDSGAQGLAEAGLIVVRSIQGRPAVLLPQLRSVHVSGALIFAQACAS